MDGLELSDFDESTVDKVYRLLEVLKEIDRHPRLNGQFALYGGTAINLFMLGLPRLSVDIDIAYIGSIEKEEMLDERPSIEAAIREAGNALGYTIPMNQNKHAGSTFLLKYRGPNHLENIKVDATYLNRRPITPLSIRKTPLDDHLLVTTFSDAELIGGKVKAFFDRVKIRDLYDISNLYRHLESRASPDHQEDQRLHEVILCYSSLSARFPFEFKGREKRFVDCEDELNAQLLPMLRKSDDRPTLHSMMQEASAFIERWVLPENDSEQKYLSDFEQGNYDPYLLFHDDSIAENAAKSPQALWKLENLRRRRSN